MATIPPEFKKSNFHPNDPVGHPCFPLPSGTVFNPSGTTGLAWENGNEELDLTLLGFEDKRVTDPECGDDYNDVILALSGSSLGASLIERLAAEFGYDADPPVA